MSHKKWTIQSIVLVTLLLLAAVTAQASYREEKARLTPDQAIAVALKDAAPAGAAHPATVNSWIGEIGANDFRLSDMGPDGDINYDAQYPAVAYNSTDNEYLVVWRGDDNTPPLVDEEDEIFGQLIDGSTAKVTL